MGSRDCVYLRSCRLLKRSLKELTLKLVSLTWLLSSQRSQSIQMIAIRNITLTNHVFKVCFRDVKTTRPGFQQEGLKAYAPDRSLCVVTLAMMYLERTKLLRGESQIWLFISYQKLYANVSRDTIRMWVIIVMRRAGLNTLIFTLGFTCIILVLVLKGE